MPFDIDFSAAGKTLVVFFWFVLLYFDKIVLSIVLFKAVQHMYKIIDYV